MNSMNGSRGATGSTKNMFSGDIIPKGYKTGQLQQFTPEQLQLFQQLFSQIGPESYLSRLAGGDEELFSEMEAPALRQFSGELGNIASRFSGMGLGGRHSSGFQNTATSAASNFAQELQAKRQGLQRQAIQDLFGMQESLLNQRPYERLYAQKPPKQEGTNWGGLIGGALGGIGGYFAGDPLTGASLGYKAGSMF